MQKINYIIFFILILALAMVSFQLTDYHSITKSLLKDNSTSNTHNNNLQDTITLLKNETEQLKTKIILLEETLSRTQIELNNQTILQNYTSNINDYSLQPKPLTIEEVEKSDPMQVTPNITLDDENEITGFGIEYKQQF
ncbi:MAG: hypothetical protein WA945_04730 [Arcobacteraceae bacterium]